MRIKLCTCALWLGACFLVAASCLAQKVPVVMQSPGSLNGDQTALKFSRSLGDEIQLSGKFYFWAQNSEDLPPDGLVILVRSVQVKLSDGTAIGFAIFVEADRRSTKDPGYHKVVSEQMWMMPKDESPADETRSFLAEVDRSLRQ